VVGLLDNALSEELGGAHKEASRKATGKHKLDKEWNEISASGQLLRRDEERKASQASRTTGGCTQFEPVPGSPNAA